MFDFTLIVVEATGDHVLLFLPQLTPFSRVLHLHLCLSDFRQLLHHGGNQSVRFIHDTIRKLEQFKMTFQNVLGLRAAIASLDDPEFEAFSRDKIAEARQFTYALLDDLGLKYTPSQGNFVLFHTGKDIRAFQQDMRKRNIQVGRPFPPYMEWCRQRGLGESMHKSEAQRRKELELQQRQMSERALAPASHSLAPLRVLSVDDCSEIHASI